MSWDPKLFHWHLKTRRFGREALYFDEVDSTNRWMLENYTEFTLSGGVIVAGHQTAGRGRHDRVWLDAPGQSLLFSIELRNYGGDGNLAMLSFLPAIALGEFLEEMCSRTARVELKWPNDVLVNGRKISGILGNTSGSGSSRVIVVGVGINVQGAIDSVGPGMQLAASTIEAECGTAPRREVLLAEILNRMEPLYDHVLEGDFEAARSRWLRLGPSPGSLVTRTEGTSVLSGEFAGLGHNGELLIRDVTGQVHELLSGDVHQS